MDPGLDFSVEEIQEQLDKLGIKNCTQERLEQIKREIHQMYMYDLSQSSISTDSESKERETHTLAQPQPQQQSKAPLMHHPQEQRKTVSSQPVQRQQVNIQMSHDPPVHIPTEPAPRLERAVSMDSTLDSTTSSEAHRILRRKVLRKVDGHSQIFDESSVTESETGDEFADFEERLQAGRARYGARPSTAPEHRAKWHNRPQSAEPVYRLSEDYEGPTALIRPMRTEPHKQNLHKNDPVARYQQYNSSWKNQKAPGERTHANLRWNVREHMLYHDQVVIKKQKPVGEPNAYKVPTEKKRKALRWQVRNDLAQGLLPPSILD